MTRHWGTMDWLALGTMLFLVPLYAMSLGVPGAPPMWVAFAVIVFGTFAMGVQFGGLPIDRDDHAEVDDEEAKWRELLEAKPSDYGLGKVR